MGHSGVPFSEGSSRTPPFYGLETLLAPLMRLPAPAWETAGDLGVVPGEDRVWEEERAQAGMGCHKIHPLGFQGICTLEIKFCSEMVPVPSPPPINWPLWRRVMLRVPQEPEGKCPCAITETSVPFLMQAGQKSAPTLGNVPYFCPP